MGSIDNEAIWDSTTQRWQGSQQRRTLIRDADYHQQYLLHGHSLQHVGCVAKPLMCMGREHIFMCIVHCIMAVGQLVVQFSEALCNAWIRYSGLVSSPFWMGHTPGFARAPLPPWMGRRCTACCKPRSTYKMRPAWSPSTGVVALYWRCGSYCGSYTAHTSMGRPKLSWNTWPQHWGPTTSYFWSRAETMSWRPYNPTAWP